MEITVNKITVITDDGLTVITPDTNSKWWEKVSETETTMTINIKD